MDVLTGEMLDVYPDEQHARHVARDLGIHLFGGGVVLNPEPLREGEPLGLIGRNMIASFPGQPRSVPILQ